MLIFSKQKHSGSLILVTYIHSICFGIPFHASRSALRSSTLGLYCPLAGSLRSANGSLSMSWDEPGTRPRAVNLRAINQEEVGRLNYWEY